MKSIREILSASENAAQTGVYSVCCANPLVLRACLRRAKASGSMAAFEATANQVNQFGGYTGMKPADFAAMLRSIAAEEGLAPDEYILGGDHLGPLIWSGLPENEAMPLADELVRSYVLAGFDKIHIDTSMRLADDDQNAPLDLNVCARRGAFLAQSVWSAYEELKKANPAARRPALIIGSEVPIPGGSQEKEDGVTPTSPEEFKRQYRVFRETFSAANVPFEDVVAFVVQPGVEFGDDFVFQYNAQKAASLTASLKDCPPLVFEGHSTDYQTRAHLRAMVQSGIRILKIGPALTFVLREGLQLLEAIETICVAEAEKRSGFTKALLFEMDGDDKYWKKYYSGSPSEIAYKKLYSYSDRCRYYLPAERIQKSVSVLLGNLPKIPEALLSLYFPNQYRRFMDGKLSNDAQSVLLDRIGECCDDYIYACGVKTE